MDHLVLHKSVKLKTDTKILRCKILYLVLKHCLLKGQVLSRYISNTEVSDTEVLNTDVFKGIEILKCQKLLMYQIQKHQICREASRKTEDTSMEY